MGLEDERRMLTGSGDPPEVRRGGGRGSGPSPPERRALVALLLPPAPLEFAGSGELVPLTPRISSVTLGK